MTFIERINYYAKGVGAIVGGLSTFIALIVAATKDGSVDGGDISTLVVGLSTLIGTIVYVIKKGNIEPAWMKYDSNS